MKTHTRISAALLSASMLLTTAFPAWSAAPPQPESSAQGSVTATVRIDYPQYLEELNARQVQAELLQGETSLGTVDLTRPGTQPLSNDSTAEVSMRNRDNGPLENGPLPGCLDVTVSNLPQGNYALRFTGTGYRTCSVPFAIDNYTKYIELGTGDGTFSLGDLDGNGTVDSADRDAIAAALGPTQGRHLPHLQVIGGDSRGKIEL